MSENNFISIKGARVNNLKNIDVDIPRDKLVVLTYGEYVVALFGADDLVDDFVNTMTATYTGVQTACDEPLQ